MNKNKRILWWIVIGVTAILATGMLSAQKITPSKNYVTRTIDNISQFDAIMSSGTADIVYTQKPGAPSVSVYCPENLFEFLDIYTSGGTLTVKLKENPRVSGNYKMIVTASSNGLKKATSLKTGDITIKETLTGTDLDLLSTGTGDIDAENIKCDNINSKVTGTGDMGIKSLECSRAEFTSSGTGDIEIKDIACDKIEIKTSDTGDIKLSGAAGEAVYLSSGTGDITAKWLTAKHVKATSSGTGDIECYASESITAKASGSADITYYGNPKTVTKDGRGNKIRAR